MLTRSANVSPNIPGFHYAPTCSPCPSPSRVSVAPASGASRRPSSSLSPPLPGQAASAVSAVSAVSSLSPASTSTLAIASAQPFMNSSLSGTLADRPVASSTRPAAPAVSALLSTPSTTPSTTLPTTTSTTLPTVSASPSTPRYVAVDAETQYSPMEPFDYAAHPRRYPPPQPCPLDPPPIPGPIPMEPGIEQGAGQASGADPLPKPPPERPTWVASTPASGDQPMQPLQPLQPQKLQSPNKRRSSHDLEDMGSSYRGTGEEGDPDDGQDGRDHGGQGSPGGPASPTSLTRSPPPGSKRVKAEAKHKVLPERYELCAVEDMVVLVANMLGELIETNDALALKAGHLTRFHSRTAPGISVLEYLNRLAKHATLTPPLLLSMVYYIDRLCAMYPDFTINTLTVHRFLITAATVAAKGLSDAFWNNSTYARIGGVRVTELKMLELEFLYRLEWKIVPNPEVLAAYYRPLVERCTGYVLAPAATSLTATTSTSTTATTTESGSRESTDMEDEEDRDVGREESDTGYEGKGKGKAEAEAQDGEARQPPLVASKAMEAGVSP